MRPGGLRKRPESTLGGLVALLEGSRVDFGPFHDGLGAKKHRSGNSGDIFHSILGSLFAPFRYFSDKKKRPRSENLYFW